MNASEAHQIIDDDNAECVIDAFVAGMIARAVGYSDEHLPACLMTAFRAYVHPCAVPAAFAAGHRRHTLERIPGYDPVRDSRPNTLELLDATGHLVTTLPSLNWRLIRPVLTAFTDDHHRHEHSSPTGQLILVDGVVGGHLWTLRLELYPLVANTWG